MLHFLKFTIENQPENVNVNVVNDAHAECTKGFQSDITDFGRGQGRIRQTSHARMMDRMILIPWTCGPRGDSLTLFLSLPVPGRTGEVWTFRKSRVITDQ
jgi:hypothetical protein